MKNSNGDKKRTKRKFPQINRLNPEKVEKTKNYDRKHKKSDKDKAKGKHKISPRSERSNY